MLSKDMLEEIYMRNIDTVYRVCRLYMKNTADTEDAVSDTFVRLMRSGKSFDSHEHEKAWLIVTAGNICKDMLKSPRCRTEELTEDMLTGDTAIDETILSVKALPEKYKTVVYLHYYEGCSCEEIAKMLGLHRSTVGSRLTRGRNILKKMLGGDHNEAEKGALRN